MNREDLILMAREAGWMSEYESSTGFSAEAAIKFAALVASAEREACALLCYEQRKHWDALACADAIRAGTKPRGQA